MKTWQVWLIISALIFGAPFVYGFVSLWRRRRQVERETLWDLAERCAKLEMEVRHGGPLTEEEYQRRKRMESMCILVRDDDTASTMPSVRRERAKP